MIRGEFEGEKIEEMARDAMVRRCGLFLGFDFDEQIPPYLYRTVISRERIGMPLMDGWIMILLKQYLSTSSFRTCYALLFIHNLYLPTSCLPTRLISGRETRVVALSPDLTIRKELLRTPIYRTFQNVYSCARISEDFQAKSEQTQQHRESGCLNAT